MMPLARWLEYASKRVFFTVPEAVAITIYLSSAYSRTGNIAVIRSSLSNGKILTIGRPRAVRLANGNWYTFNQYNLPRSEKHNIVSWVLATNKRSMKSSSFILVAALPLPPRR